MMSLAQPITAGVDAVSLNRPALALGPGPRGVQEARRWAGDICAAIGRPELVECARLGVSELVTNALLHGSAPIELRVSGTSEHPRFEVHDSSTEAPVLPAATDIDLDSLGADPDEMLLTFGRGLTMVARSSIAWGADIGPDGKNVWFVPAAAFAEGEGVQGILKGWLAEADGRSTAVPDPVTVHVLGVPITAYTVFTNHLRELRREVRLLALAHESASPLARDLADLFGTLERHLRDVIGIAQQERALAEGRTAMDLEVQVARAVTQTLSRFSELLDLADEFCREERLLSLVRSPEQRHFQRWLLGEFVRQGNGEQPIPWTEVHVGRRSVVS